jgi:hypothetical protein
MIWYDVFVVTRCIEPEQTSLWNKLLEKVIRDIHSKQEFHLTDKLKEQIRDIGEVPPEKMSVKSKQYFNPKFKELGINDQIQIEHMTSVKNIIKKIWLLKKENPNPTPEMIESLMNENTNCIYKLRKKEKELHG